MQRKIQFHLLEFIMLVTVILILLPKWKKWETENQILPLSCSQSRTMPKDFNFKLPQFVLNFFSSITSLRQNKELRVNYVSLDNLFNISVSQFPHLNLFPELHKNIEYFIFHYLNNILLSNILILSFKNTHKSGNAIIYAYDVCLMDSWFSNLLIIFITS